MRFAIRNQTEKSSEWPFRKVDIKEVRPFNIGKSSKTFFCHYIHDGESSYDVCVDYDASDKLYTIAALAQESEFSNSRLMLDPNEIELRARGQGKTEGYYLNFLEHFESQIPSHFLNLEDTLDVDVSTQYPIANRAKVRVVGRGQFSVVFAIDNVLPDLAFRRFSGFKTIEEANNFISTHEAALVAYDELELPVIPTTLTLVKGQNSSFSAYLIQPLLAPDQLAENHIEKYFSDPNGVCEELSSKSNKKTYCLFNREAVMLILEAVLSGVYQNLLKLKSDDSAVSICCDGKPDNFQCNFAYKSDWLKIDLSRDSVDTAVSLTDFHPCSLVLFDKLLFDGGPHSQLFTELLSSTPFDDYQIGIRNWADAKKLVTKSLANIAYHAGDQSEDELEMLVARSKHVLFGLWNTHDSELNDRYKQSRSEDTATIENPGLDYSKLFFDLDELNLETVLAYREDSRKKNFNLRLHYYILRIASDLAPQKFELNDFTPVDNQQDWWLRVVSFYHKEELRELLENTIVDSVLDIADQHEKNRMKLREEISEIVNNDKLVLKSGLLRLLHWHFKQKRKAGSFINYEDRERQLILRDHWLIHLQKNFHGEMQVLVNIFMSMGYEHDEASLPKLLKDSNIGSFIDQKVEERQDQESFINQLFHAVFKQYISSDSNQL